MSALRIVPCVFVLLLAALPGCQASHTGTATPAADASGATTSEAERTREMERKAADIEKRTEALKTMTGSEQEKIDAANQLDKERRELADQAESGQGHH
jgi:hypothetical protein